MDAVLSWVPNGICLVRVILAYVVARFIIREEWIGAFIVINMGIGSDILDGYAAHHLGSLPYGELVDVIADAIFQIAVVAAMWYRGYLPNWYIVTLIVVGLISFLFAVVILPAGSVGQIFAAAIQFLNSVFAIVAIEYIVGYMAFGLSGVVVVTMLVTTLTYFRWDRLMEKLFAGH